MFGSKEGVTRIEGFATAASVQDILLLRDGRMLMVGQGFLVRLRPDGTLDTTFNRDGIAVTSTSSFAPHPPALAQQADGKIAIVHGNGSIQWTVQRFDANGALDGTFAQGGTVTTPSDYVSGSDNAALDVAALSGGKLLVAGRIGAEGAGQLALVRYLADGSLDTSFSGDGIATADVPQGWESAQQLLLQGNSYVVAGVQHTIAGTRAFVLARFKADGTLDTAFGDGGTAHLRWAQPETYETAAALQSDGKILLAAPGPANDSGDNHTLVARFTRDGVLDTTFGERGVLKVPAVGTGNHHIETIAVQSDGKIVLGGTIDTLNSRGTWDRDFLLIRLKANGNLDTSFGDDGIVARDLGAWDGITALAVQPDGKIVAAGHSDGKPTIVRFKADGGLDYSLPVSGSDELADRLTGTSDDDTLLGLGGDDELSGAQGDDRLDGGAGFDLAVYDRQHTDYLITRAGDGFTVKDRIGADGTDSVTQVERIRFSDGYVALDTGGTAGQAYRLYQAAFDRTPDVPGLGYQINALDQGLSLLQVAQNFIDSPEFARTYGALNDLQFVTQLYANVLDRAPDEGGLAFHTGNLAAGLSRAAVLEGFSESPENQANVIGAIENGIFYTL